MSADPYNLERFVRAQDSRRTYQQALEELRAGQKRGHWMWFVLPQVAGLGHSPMAQLYAVSSAAEAREFLQHPVLGPRLRECMEALVELPASDPTQVLGGIDAVKLRSCATLFQVAAKDERDAELFDRVLQKFFDGRRDAATLGILGVG